MPVSLTRDEFLERLREREKLLRIAIAHDLEHSKDPIKFGHEANGDIYFEMSEALGPVFRNILLRVIDLVYQEEQ